MKFAIIALVTTALVPASAWAATDKPLSAPAPAWVKPVPAPSAAPADDQGAVQILLQDQQIAFVPGKTSSYAETVVKIAKPEGLGVGNLSFAWDPERQVPTVHKLLIRRGDKVIDVLASGQTFTVLRRETNLDAATLDGVLTANIQPEGLQVGDVIDFAMTIESSDPVLKNHVEAIAGGWNGASMMKAHARLQWPAEMAMRLRSTGDLPKLKAAKDGNLMVAEVTLGPVKPYVAPKGAPLRFQFGRQLEVTDYRSWGELGAIMAPLYGKAAAIPAQDALHDELEKVRSASADPKARGEAALRLVQERVRYVALLMGAGGYDPVSAELTWSRRYGDCKAKTALLLGLLRALGIEADPVAVSAPSGDGLDGRLPAAGLFNHVLVRAIIAGRTYWLDGTRTGDRSLDRLAVPDYGWGLPLIAHDAALVRMTPGPLEVPGDETNIRIDATAGLTVPAPVTVEQVLRGDYAASVNATLANLSGEARDRGLRGYWRQRFNFIDVKDAKAIIDQDKGETKLTMSGLATMDWSSGRYETDETGVGYEADFQREPGPDVDAPFAVPYPIYDKVTEMVLLPAGFAGHKATNSRDVDQTVAGIHYVRETSFSGTTFMVSRSRRSVAPEFAAKDAPAAQAALRELANHAIYIGRPSEYIPTMAEADAGIAAKPDNANAYIDRGNLHLNEGEYDLAISDFSKAATLDPKDPWALANRGLAEVSQERYAAATKDLDAAAELDAGNPVIFRARGAMAEQQGRYKDALAAYDRSLELDPGNRYAIGRRIATSRAMGDEASALRDAAAAIARRGDDVEMYLLRANIFRKQGKQEEALAEAAALSRANPNNVEAQVTAGRIYDGFGKQQEAMAAFDRAIAIKPESYVYLNRALSRPKADLDGRRADVDTALKLDPRSSAALAEKARVQTDARDFEGALATAATAVAAQPKSSYALVQRGIAYERASKPALAAKDFDAAKAMARQPAELNGICWAKAVAGVALERALVECDTGLAGAPDSAPIMDSKGLVLLRLGRVDDAISMYDAALTKTPQLSSSLYGRGLARLKKGDAAAAEQDRKAALAADPDIVETFADMGLTWRD